MSLGLFNCRLIQPPEISYSSCRPSCRPGASSGELYSGILVTRHARPDQREGAEVSCLSFSERFCFGFLPSDAEGLFPPIHPRIPRRPPILPIDSAIEPIYHAQITDGDICRTIRDNIAWIVHFHVAGVPGRHEPDATQELNYRFIAQTIADLGFTGYVAHEWTPSSGSATSQSLALAVDILDV
jgi:hypothetical protein